MRQLCVGVIAMLTAACQTGAGVETTKTGQIAHTLNSELSRVAHDRVQASPDGVGVGVRRS
jgi:hypothetical protein